VRSRIITANESVPRTVVNSKSFRLAENHYRADSAPTIGLAYFAPESS